MKVLLASVIALSACTPAMAHHQQAGYSETNTCYREEYREEYVPGTSDNPGYVRSWQETIEYPCKRSRIERTPENTTRRITRLIITCYCWSASTKSNKGGKCNFHFKFFSIILLYINQSRLVNRLCHFLNWFHT